MNHQDAVLNIRYDAPAEIWDKLTIVYEKSEGWIGYGTNDNEGENGIPYWFGFNEKAKHICASVEPGGLQFTAYMEDDEWERWLSEIKQLATSILGYKIGEIEKGEVDF